MEAESPKKPRDRFEPYPSFVAMTLAERASAAYVKFKESQSYGSRQCKICNHPERVQIDYALLMGRSIYQLVREFNLPKGQTERANPVHRDLHLLPLLAREVLNATARMVEDPYPANFEEPESDYERARWHILQAYGMRAKALDTENTALALRALQEMRTIDRDLLQPAIERRRQRLKIPLNEDNDLVGLLPAPRGVKNG